MSFAERYAVLLKRFRFVVIIFWLVLGITGAFFTVPFIRGTTQAFNPPSGTQSYRAQQVLEGAFQLIPQIAHFSIFLKSTSPNTSLLTNDVQTYLIRVSSAVNQMVQPGEVSDFATYFTLKDIHANALAEGLIAENGTAMAVPLVFNAPFTSKRAGEFGAHLVEIVNHQLAITHHPTFVAEVNGLPVFITDIISSVEKDMGLMDAIVMPIALVVMMFTVRSARLAILPVISIGLSLVVSFAGMYLVTLATEVSASTPSLMMSLCIAMSIDYNLFILSRFMDELRTGVRGVAVVSTVLGSSGRTVLVSGTTLMISFLGLIFFPLAILRSFGYGCAMAIFIAMAVSLSGVPAMLLAFPNFFEAAAIPMKEQHLYKLLCCKKDDDDESTPRPNGFSSKRRSTNEATLLAEDAADRMVYTSKTSSKNGTKMVTPRFSSSTYGRSPSRLSDILTTETDSTWPRSFFFRLRYILRWPANLICFTILVGITCGVASQALHFETTDSFRGYLPRATDSFRNFEQFAASFGYGYTEPYKIIFVANRIDKHFNENTSDVSAVSPQFFAYAQGLLRKISRDASLPATSKFTSMWAYGDNHWPSYEDFEMCRNPVTSGSCDANIRVLMAQGINQDKDAALGLITVDIEPTGNFGNVYYKGLLSLIENYQRETAPYSGNWSVFVDGVGPASMDSIDKIYEDFPKIIAITGSAVLLVVGIAFRSIMVPLRSLISIALTEGFVFGVSVLTFQTGIFDWTGWPNLSTQGAVTFTAPIVGFTVIVGVALDYDIFLLTRIFDVAKDDALDTRTSVLRGLCHTGKIITAAGVIMAIAFFGLVLSSVGALNVLGWFMCTAVLFDTFVVRTLVVPSLMSLMGAYNWWPTKLPQDFM